MLLKWAGCVNCASREPPLPQDNNKTTLTWETSSTLSLPSFLPSTGDESADAGQGPPVPPSAVEQGFGVNSRVCFQRLVWPVECAW